MPNSLNQTTRRRLDIQGFEREDDIVLAQYGRWLRLAFVIVAVIAGIGTVTASPMILLVLFPFAVVAAISPVHPFDLIYNYGIRYITETGPLPRRGAPSRFAGGLAAVWLLATAYAFYADLQILGYVLGGMLTGVSALVGTTDICIPSLIFRTIFGFPPRR
jgi:hypothetical protein